MTNAVAKVATNRLTFLGCYLQEKDTGIFFVAHYEHCFLNPLRWLSQAQDSATV